MCKRHVVYFVRTEVLKTHGNHRRLFLLDINELNQTLLATSFKIPSGLVVSQLSTSMHISLLVQHHLDVPLTDLQLVVFNDIQRPLHTSCVCEKTNFSAMEVAYD